MAHFQHSIYYPLLDYLPKDWFNDFENIMLKFDPSEHLSFATLSGKVFTVNIDLDRLEQVTKKEGSIPVAIFRYFGNLAFIVTRAFYKYNADKHPEIVKDTSPEKVVNTFMVSVGEKWRRNGLRWKDYTV